MRAGGVGSQLRANRAWPTAAAVGIAGALAAALVTAAPVRGGEAAVTTPFTPAAAERAFGQVVDVGALRAAQDAVVTARHQGAITLARFAVSELTATVSRDRDAMASDQGAEQEARAVAAAADARLGADQSALAAATAERVAADARLAGDRARMRQIGLGMYTGALTNPQPDSLRALEADQAQMIDAAEVEVVAGVVDGHLHADLLTAGVDSRRQVEASDRVTSDRSVAARENTAADRAAARTASDRAALAADQARLTTADGGLARAQAALATELASIAGSPSVAPGQLGLLGGAALSADQLVGWFDSQGFADLTSAPIADLASWYIEAGAQEGVRGDVAFAQAVLETGGFSSPDAVGLSNFAGIGHCDSCAAGWGFPSPQAGVIGQVQLLRIFADAGAPPAGSPAPVLADLTPARQSRAGCCVTVEALTGVWATDPGYAQQILGIYGQMLSYALATPSPT